MGDADVLKREGGVGFGEGRHGGTFRGEGEVQVLEEAEAQLLPSLRL